MHRDLNELRPGNATDPRLPRPAAQGEGAGQGGERGVAAAEAAEREAERLRPTVDRHGPHRSRHAAVGTASTRRSSPNSTR